MAKDKKITTVNLFKPTLRRQDMQSVLETMADEAIGPGVRKTEFEDAMKELTGFDYAYALRSLGTSLQIIFDELDLEEGARILISPLAPSIYKRIADLFGYTLVFADTDPSTGLLKYNENAESVDAIIHYLTTPALPDEEYKKFQGKTVIDVSPALGLKNVNGFCKYAVCSLEDDDVISAGGGAVILSNDPLDNTIYKEDSMPDLNAALGLVQYKFFASNSQKRREIVQVYQNAFMRSGSKNKLFGLPDADLPQEEYNAFRFAITLSSKVEDAMKYATKSKVEIKRLFEDSLVSTLGLRDDELTNSIYTATRTVYFPLYYFLKSNEIEEVSKMIAHLL